eukprot:06418_3
MVRRTVIWHFNGCCCSSLLILSSTPERQTVLETREVRFVMNEDHFCDCQGHVKGYTSRCVIGGKEMRTGRVGRPAN